MRRHKLFEVVIHEEAFRCLRENSTCQIAVDRKASKLDSIQPRSGGMTLARRVSAG